jgi:FtsP/CotA-like multicopper oxidase with cupredoxin domain
VITRARVRALVGVVLTLAIVGPLGWMWWSSLLPSSYSVMDMGYADYGGGPRPVNHDMAGMAGMQHAASEVSVTSLDTRKGGRPDVVVDLTARQGKVKLASGKTVEGYTINGTSPGPVIRATLGDLVEVHLHNDDVEGGVALHWHGVDVPNAEDGVAGVTQNAVKPGQDYTYRWVAPHAGTFWYHSHQMSHEQVSGGLLGGIVITPKTLTPRTVDFLAVEHLYDGTATINGETGDQRVPAKPGQLVRVRVVNTDSGAQVAWASIPFRVAAVDGYDVSHPDDVSGKGVEIPAGGRADLVLATPADGSAARVEVLGGPGLVIGPEGASAPAVKQPVDDNVDLLHYGRPTPSGMDTSDFDRTFKYSIGRRPGFINGRPGLWWSINGHLYPDMPMMTVREGDVVKVTISNHSGKSHPMHIHGHHAIVLSRDGKKVTGSPWWFDSLEVRSGETFEVAFVADNPGIWMDHCHNLKHAREGMVTHLMYEGVSTPYKLGSDSGNEPE